MTTREAIDRLVSAFVPGLKVVIVGKIYLGHHESHPWEQFEVHVIKKEDNSMRVFIGSTLEEAVFEAEKVSDKKFDPMDKFYADCEKFHRCCAGNITGEGGMLYIPAEESNRPPKEPSE